MQESALSQLDRGLFLVVSSGQVDRAWYLTTYADVADAQADPVLHYYFQGWREGRDPSSTFDSEWYRRTHMTKGDPRCPVLHFIQVGWQLGAATRLGGEPCLTPPRGAIVSSIASVRSDAVPPKAWTTGDLMERSLSPAIRPPAQEGFRLIAHYLPQFHRTPENDRFWGDGFTDWVNVRRGLPRVANQSQPHVPLFGEYDLSNREVLGRQSDLARRHGISAFCFYVYWFDGQRVLSEPVDNFHADRHIAMDFLVCWANENWSRNWDGGAGDILLEQHYSPQGDIDFIEAHSSFLRDPRYVRVNGAPVLAVYRVEQLPDPRATATRWRQWCRDNGIGEIYLVAMQSFEDTDPRTVGFDASAEFWPNNGQLSKIPVEVDDYEGHVYDWTEFVDRSYSYEKAPFRLHRGVCLSWDNEARQPGKGTFLDGATPDLFRQWLLNAAQDALAMSSGRSDALVFVNAWNEWAEGCHLEPDEQWGYQWLHACRDVQMAVGRSLGELPQFERPRPLPVPAAGERSSTSTEVLIVVHDLHPHGTQFLALELARTLDSMGYRVELVALESGPLLNQVPEQVPVTVASDLRVLGWDESCNRVAIVCSLAASSAVPQLESMGNFRVIQLVNELPTLIRDRGLMEAARSSADLSDVWVYPSELVRRRIEAELDLAPRSVIVRTQGRIVVEDRGGDAPISGAYRQGSNGAKTEICGAGYADYRKGFDRFVAIAKECQISGWRFRWIGDVDLNDERIREAKDVFDTLPNAEWTPHNDAYLSVLEKSSLLLMTSREDPFPNVVVDAFISGIPVVAFSGCTGAEDAILRYGGAVLREDDPTLVCKALQHILVDREGVSSDQLEERIAAAELEFAFDSYASSLLAICGLRRPTVGVGIPSYNHQLFLNDRIESVLRQTLPVDELYFLDDRSTDGSFEAASVLLSKFGEGARLEQEPVNSGFVFGQWRKLATSMTSDLVWIAESDDDAHPEFLDLLVAKLVDPAIGMVFSMSAPMSPEGTQLADDYSNYLNQVVPWINWREDFTFSNSPVGRDVFGMINPVLTASSVVFRRDALVQAFDFLGGRIEEFRRAGDWLVYAAILSSWDIAYVAQPLALHRRHEHSVIGAAEPVGLVSEIRAAQTVINTILGGHAPNPIRVKLVDDYLEGLA